MSSNRKKLVAKLDRVFSKYIRARDKRCVICGRTDKLTCGHLFSRVAYSTRWEPDNAFCQCTGCNLSHEHDPLPLVRYAEKIHGKEKIDALHRTYRTTRKFSDADLRELIDKYKEKYERLCL